MKGAFCLTQKRLYLKNPTNHQPISLDKSGDKFKSP